MPRICQVMVVTVLESFHVSCILVLFIYSFIELFPQYFSWSLLQACKLVPDIGHLSGKFEGFDWRILSLTGHVDWALPLLREIKKYIFT